MPRIFLAVIFAIASLAAMQRPANWSGVIGGRLVDADTHLGIADAYLTLYEQDPPTNRNLGTVSERSNKSGEFRFSRLPPGRFWISSLAQGYSDTSVGQRRVRGTGYAVTLASGQRAEVTLESWRGATITGRVLDENGQPVVGAYVRPIDVTLGTRPPPRNLPTGFGLTDDRGIYRIVGVPPGDWLIATSTYVLTSRFRPESGSTFVDLGGVLFRNDRLKLPKPAPTPAPGTLYFDLSGESRPPSPSPQGESRMYETYFYPGVRQVRNATRIHVNSGQLQEGVDIRITIPFSTTVAGRVVPSIAPAGAHLFLRRDEAFPGDIVVAQTYLESDGSFTFVSVPVGRYVLEVQRLFGRGDDMLLTEGPLTTMLITVPRRGIADIHVPFWPGAEVVGKIVTEGGMPQWSFSTLYPLLPLRSVPPSPFPQPLPQTRTSEGADRFAFRGIGRGRYFVSGTGLTSSNGRGSERRWTLKSAVLNGVDVTSHPLEVTGPDIDGLLVTLTEKKTRIFGEVYDASGLIRGGTVVVFPVDQTTWLDDPPDQMPRFSAGRAPLGRFSVERLPPGEYYVAAVDERSMDAWPTREFLVALVPTAERVTLHDGDEVQLRLLSR